MNYFLLFLLVLSFIIFDTYIIISYNFFLIQDYLRLQLWNLKSYDYIIVGAGTAGSIIANRLSKTNKKVLLLESGTYGGRLLDIPAAGVLLQGSNYDWKYKTVPQKNACKALKNNVSVWPRGKIIGGTGRLNYMVYLRGGSNVYDKWFENYTNSHKPYNFEEDIMWYFKKAESYSGQFENDDHGQSGFLEVSKVPFESEMVNSILEAAKELNIPIRDLNSRHKTGFMKVEINMKNGQRWSTGHNLFFNNPNLDVIANAFVTKINFISNKAKSVEFQSFSKTYRVQARKAIILSAGSINTPKLLMLSGIGPKKHLKQLKIPVVADLPVGENLADHLTTGLDLILTNTSSPLSLANMFSPIEIFKYFFGSSSTWTSPGCEVIGLINYNDLLTKLDYSIDLVLNLKKVSDQIYNITSDLSMRFYKLKGINRDYNQHFNLTEEFLQQYKILNETNKDLLEIVQKLPMYPSEVIKMIFDVIKNISKHDFKQNCTICDISKLVNRFNDLNLSLRVLSSNIDLKLKQEMSWPDLEIMVMPATVTEDNGIRLRKDAGITDDVFESYFKNRKDKHLNGLSIIPVLLHPKSLGYLKLKDTNPFSELIIEPNYLSDMKDVKTLINGIKFLKILANTNALRKFGFQLNNHTLENCDKFKFDTDGYWECYIRHFTFTVYHPTGTCKMGERYYSSQNTKVQKKLSDKNGNSKFSKNLIRDSSAVVDYNFKVYDISNLYVCDASVFPEIPGANTNSAVAMMAERVVDILKYENYLNVGKCYLIDYFLRSKIC